MKTSKKLIAVVIALAVALGTSACIKLNMNLTVTSNDLISGSVVSAVSKELADYAAESGQATTSESLFPNNPKVTRTPLNDGKWVGDTYTFRAMPISEFNAFGDSSSSLRITRDGDNLQVTGVLDMSTGDTSGDTSSLGIDPASLFDVKFSITLPGRIISSSGTATGNTITWKGKYGVPLEISAVALAPKSNASTPISVTPNAPSNLTITNITATSVTANYEFPAGYSQMDLKKNPYYLGYFSTKNGKLLGQQYISSVTGPTQVTGLGNVTERNLTFKIISRFKKTYGNVKVTLPQGPSVATKLTYKKNSFKQGQVTITWAYKALNDSEAVSGFKIYVASAKNKYDAQEFLVLDPEARSAALDGKFEKNTSYVAWIFPTLINGLDGPKSQFLNFKTSK